MKVVPASTGAGAIRFAARACKRGNMGRSDTKVPLGRPGEPSPPAAPELLATPSPSAEPLRSAVDADSILRQFLPQFVAELPPIVAAVVDRLERRELAGLAKSVHQLKGAGAFYGFPQISTAAAEAERRIKQPEPMDAVRQGVEQLVRLVRNVEGYDPGLERQAVDGSGSD